MVHGSSHPLSRLSLRLQLRLRLLPPGRREPRRPFETFFLFSLFFHLLLSSFKPSQRGPDPLSLAHRDTAVVSSTSTTTTSSLSAFSSTVSASSASSPVSMSVCIIVVQDLVGVVSTFVTRRHRVSHAHPTFPLRRLVHAIWILVPGQRGVEGGVYALSRRRV